ncbi:esterase/lipase family protein [Dyadobacter tibetensis]|uniref:esterase/lipase family protein n=1 Tax=Dyadobacter tibetensis TaxID=1211851 RepID=UPI0004723DB5|nr:hypothetical protein [Dyadobacter tibetensis]
MDVSGLKEKVVLNKAIVIEEMLAPFQNREKDRDGATVTFLPPGMLPDLIDLAERGDMENKKKPDAIEKILKRQRKEITTSQVVPVGIINLDALMLSEAQVQDNMKAHKEGKKADISGYESLELIAAGLLQEEIFQGDVQFLFGKALVYANNKNKIESIGIDFQDGKGWHTFAMKDELVSHRFDALGEVAISIRLVTDRGVYITRCILQVKMLERLQPDLTGTIPAENSPNGRESEFVINGEFAIYNGCDRVFNKPIIIMEGFDIDQKTGIDDLLAKYYPYLSTFLNHGYDLVFLNYNNGQAAIQDNAQVLKRLIIEIKNRIPAGDSLIVIGESMSGLVARYALREMENAGTPHKVKLFVAFDTPHQGANTAPGLVALRRSLGSLGGWATPIAYLLSREVRSIDSPAAKQMLIYHNGILRHPDFTSFRQSLANLGNGGYPSLSRNVAMLNGSINGARQRNQNGNLLNPGEKLLDIKVRTFLGGGNVRVYSNVPGQNTDLLDAWTSSFLTPFGFSDFKATLPYNYDRLPGGFSSSDPIDFKGVTNSVSPKFTFMPVFSSIDYRGALGSDDAYTFSVAGNIVNIQNQVINPALTPFKAIYGDNDFNFQHAFPADIAVHWNTLALRELGLRADGTLASCVLPPPPAVTAAYLRSDFIWGYHPLPARLCKWTPGP